MSQLILNKTVFEQLFKEHYQNLYYHAFSILNDSELSRDFVNDTFEEIWNRRKKLDISYSLKSFLYSTIRNRCINYLRKQEVERKYINRKMNEINEEEEYRDYDSALREIMKVIESFPPQNKLVFKKCFIENLSYKEVSAELNISVNTIKTHISSALRRLRNEFNKEQLLLFYLCVQKRLSITHPI